MEIEVTGVQEVGDVRTQVVVIFHDNFLTTKLDGLEILLPTASNGIYCDIPSGSHSQISSDRNQRLEIENLNNLPLRDLKTFFCKGATRTKGFRESE